MRPPVLIALCSGLGLVAGYLGGAWSSDAPPAQPPPDTAPPSTAAPSTAPPPTAAPSSVDALSRDIEALRARVTTLEQAQLPQNRTASGLGTPVALAPPTVPTHVRPAPVPRAQPARVEPVAPTNPTRVEPNHPDPEVDEWTRFGGRDNFSEAQDLVEELPTLAVITNRRLERDLKLGGESAATLKAAVNAAAARATKLGTSYLAGQGDLRELRRQWAAIETRFRAATATLSRDEQAEVDRVIASVFKQRKWVAKLLRGGTRR